MACLLACAAALQRRGGDARDALQRALRAADAAPQLAAAAGLFLDCLAAVADAGAPALGLTPAQVGELCVLCAEHVAYAARAWGGGAEADAAAARLAALRARAPVAAGGAHSPPPKAPAAAAPAPAAKAVPTPPAAAPAVAAPEEAPAADASPPSADI